MLLNSNKSGLPHVHFLIILKSNAKIILPESFYKIVSAKILNKANNCHLYAMVLKRMIHDPCCDLNPTITCMTKTK